MAKSFLGVEISTQQIKVVAIDVDSNILYQDAFKFDELNYGSMSIAKEFFRTCGGFNIADDKKVVTAPTLMWVQAVDEALFRASKSGLEMNSIVAVSGAAQQHGSVYWKKGAMSILKHLEESKTLHEQLKDAFSVPMSPIWMDCSTMEECKLLERVVGGAQRLADITGSRGYERFTGPQICKIYRKFEEKYNETERISLVSSFLCSLFLGDYAPIDKSDACGMNLFDISNQKWHNELLQACGGMLLEEKLGNVANSLEKLGSVSEYLVRRYGFAADCQVTAFTGDNPASLVGSSVHKDMLCLSLGSSDVVSVWLDRISPGLEGHIFINPMDAEAFMGILCFKNGSLTREKILQNMNLSSWEEFSKLLQSTKAGNNGNIGMYYLVPEIVPPVAGVFRFDSAGTSVSEFPSAVEARALIEGQILSYRVHAERLGLAMSRSVLVTGGASANREILQIVADVFNSPVHVQEIVDSACLGAALQARNATCNTPLSNARNRSHCLAKPNAPVVQVYDQMITRYSILEQRILEWNQ